ncbi:MAG: thioesterase [Cellvibrionales bacterium]|nr:thioesterase [Cellvibrionales bacterium]
MSIWFEPVTFEKIEQLQQGIDGQGTLMTTLDIKITVIGEDSLTATMPAGPNIHQPFGLVHGGASIALAETVASYAANFAVDQRHYYCVGQEINANHLKASRTGVLTAVTQPIHLGKRSSVWEILIQNSAGQLCCVSRMTAAVVKRQTTKIKNP